MYPLQYRQQNLPGVYAWCKEFGRFKKKGYNGRYSHTTYDSWISKGPVEIPLEFVDAFNKKYAESWQLWREGKGPPLYFNETTHALDVIPVCFDWDVYVTAIPPAGNAQNFLEQPMDIVLSVLKRLCKKEDFRVVVTCSGIYEDVKKGHKIGYHLICPELAINKASLIPLRHALVKELTERCGLRWEDWTLSPQSDWNNIIDQARAKDPALRMVGSCNLKPCKECGKKICGNKSHFAKRFHVGQVHDLLGIYQSNGTWAEDVEAMSLEEILHLCSLRRYDGKAVEPIQLSDPKLDEPKLEGKQIEDQETLQVVSKLAWFLFGAELGGGVKYDRKQGTYVVTLKGRYCTNKGSEHTGNGGYLTITKHFVTRRCYCPKTEERGFGPCPQFKVQIALPPRTRTLLFEKKRPRLPETTPPDLDIENTCKYERLFDAILKKYSDQPVEKKARTEFAPEAEKAPLASLDNLMRDFDNEVFFFFKD